MSIIKDNMVVDPALQRKIIARIIAGNFGDRPNRSVEDLGTLDLPDGKAVALHLRHASDAVIIDDHDHVVLITRLHNPGAGLKALPGGFIDSVNGIAETPLTAAIREAMEETGMSKMLLESVLGTPVGSRAYNRPFDIRVAWNKLPGTDIEKGDFFAVSTQGFCFQIKHNLSGLSLKAGDDARAVHVLEISGLTPEQFAVPDHLDMIKAAIRR